MSGRRPEHQAPPEIYYDETEARKYTENSRIMEIQASLAERALELLCLPDDEPQLILDLGCGSGLSGAVLEEAGHEWVGLDISLPMLCAAQEREASGDLLLSDLGQGLPFRAGMFNGAISISALQWLCQADKANHRPLKRLSALFTSLRSCLATGGRAVFQFYPENARQIEMVTTASMKSGFSGGLVVDFPNSTKAKKFFLVLMTGGGPLPKALDGQPGVEQNGAEFGNRRARTGGHNAKGQRAMRGTREWIAEKKERRRRQGKNVCPDSKFSGRRRAGKF